MEALYTYGTSSLLYSLLLCVRFATESLVYILLYVLLQRTPPHEYLWFKDIHLCWLWSICEWHAFQVHGVIRQDKHSPHACHCVLCRPLLIRPRSAFYGTDCQSPMPKYLGNNFTNNLHSCELIRL